MSTTCANLTGATYTSSYDAWGNVTSRTTGGTAGTLAYDVQDHLTQWSATGKQEQYAYDASGTRTLKRSTNSGTTTLTVYAFGLEEHVYTATGSSTSNTYYYSLGGRLLGSFNGSSTQFSLTDILGSVIISFSNTATSAAVLGNQVYGPYGNQRYAKGNVGTNKGYTGQYNDSLSGLDYYKARYYDPVAGVFVSADTAEGNGQGMNPYGYVKGNPETKNDPTGHYIPAPPGKGGGQCYFQNGGPTCTEGSGGSGGGGNLPPSKGNPGLPVSKQSESTCDRKCEIDKARTAARVSGLEILGVGTALLAAGVTLAVLLAERAIPAAIKFLIKWLSKIAIGIIAGFFAIMNRFLGGDPASWVLTNLTAFDSFLIAVGMEGVVIGEQFILLGTLSSDDGFVSKWLSVAYGVTQIRSFAKRAFAWMDDFWSKNSSVSSLAWWKTPTNGSSLGHTVADYISDNWYLPMINNANEQIFDAFS